MRPEKKIKKEEEYEDENYSSKIINLQEDSLSEEESKNNSDGEDDSKEEEEYSLDEERISLRQIERIIQKRKIKENRKSLLAKKIKKDNMGVITYNEKEGKIEQAFCSSLEELNEFLVHCQIRRISFEEFSPSFINNSIPFDPDQWMKSNKISERIINFEDLSIYCQNNIEKNKKPENSINNNNSKSLIKDREKVKEVKIKKLNRILLNNKALMDNYNKLQNIISSSAISIEQKIWVNNLIKEISRMDINQIKVEKDEEGKENKLEIVFDLDNTCIFSFCSNADLLYVQQKKNIFPAKQAKMISFYFGNKVLYNVLIIRKGLKEFINYVNPLCNFHISTLGAENYGNEIKEILKEYSGVEFIRYKGRLYENENIKNISDLYINREKTIIFDDNIKVWENKTKDHENVINTKFFFDEECASLSVINQIKKNDGIFYEIEAFLKSYRTLVYSKIKESKNIDWKQQFIIEYPKSPFYQFKTYKDYDYNKCFTSEYLSSKKYQFIYMKNVIKVIYCMKFIYDIDIPTSIKLIRNCTLTNLKFDLRYLSYDQKNILIDMVKACGGIIFEKEKDKKDYEEKIYLVASKMLYELKKDEINKELEENSFYILINEKYILDTYYFMTNLIDEINDPEYTSYEQ